MPRKAPDGVGVTEHRITLGTYERKQLETVIAAEKFRDYSEAAVNGVLALGVAAVGVGSVYAGIAVYRWVTEDLLEIVDKAATRVYGHSIAPFTGPRTGSIWNPLAWL